MSFPCSQPRCYRAAEPGCLKRLGRGGNIFRGGIEFSCPFQEIATALVLSKTGLLDFVTWSNSHDWSFDMSMEDFMCIILFQILAAYENISPPLNPGIFGGGKARNFWEIFHLTTWNIPPRIFLGFLKDVGGGSSGRCSFLDLFSPYAGRAHAQTLTTR